MFFAIAKNGVNIHGYVAVIAQAITVGNRPPHLFPRRQMVLRYSSSAAF